MKLQNVGTQKSDRLTIGSIDNQGFALEDRRQKERLT
jgi:hypothetical protein